MELRRQFELVEKVVREAPKVDLSRAVPLAEFQDRANRVGAALAGRGLDVGFVFSDEHYRGDVPYLGGNTNVSIEQVAGVVGKAGFHIVAGLEGGYVAEQLAPRAGARVHKVELLQLADEKYPIQAERLEDVLAAANGGAAPRRIALLTPRQVVPASLAAYLERVVGRGGLVDAQELYYRIKYIKSDTEMALIRDASRIGDAALRAMLAVLEPGMRETEVAAWGSWVISMLGADGMGFQVMVGTGDANRTLIGKALNRTIRRGDYVHLGVAPQRDGLTSCVRRSVVAGATPAELSEDQRFWFDFVDEAYHVGLRAYVDVAARGAPAKFQERALVDYFASRSDEVSRRIGRPIDLARQKPYTGTHNAGYTECQEFFGAITLESEEPLGSQIVTMLDVAIRGIGNRWDDVVIPGLDFVVIEDTLGKSGPRVEVFNRLPPLVQNLVGNADPYRRDDGF